MNFVKKYEKQMMLEQQEMDLIEFMGMMYERREIDYADLDYLENYIKDYKTLYKEVHRGE